jgi:hypothetical protein
MVSVKMGFNGKAGGAQDPSGWKSQPPAGLCGEKVDRGRGMHADLDEVFGRLACSTFRRPFRLRPAEQEYLERRGLDTVMAHGEKFVEERLASADPPNDGKQTPMRNHPIFIAQHATATCCRGCLEKWHDIPKGHALEAEEKAYILSVLRRWLVAQEGTLDPTCEPSAFVSPVPT